MPAKDKWWDKVVSSDLAQIYKTSDKALADAGGKPPKSGRKGSLIWGDRVRILQTKGNTREISARGTTGWIHKRHLGEEALLEVYVVDVGQGDGLLVVTPEGHNIMVDGGNIRAFQNGGKNAADFVDWKFFYDYLSPDERDDQNKTVIALDAMVASHNDIDHFGGLWDLIDRDPRNDEELDSTDVTVERFYHAGLSWWFKGSGKSKRELGPTSNGHYTKLLGDRNSAKAATANLSNPDKDTLSGSWGKFIGAATKLKRGSGASTAITRLSTETHEFLPGFEPGGDSACSIRLLGPIEGTVSRKPALKKFPDGDSKNTNGHSIVLRLDYGDRRILLTGDLNTHSQNHIMKHFGSQFVPEFMVDVAKGCHHGSHDVSYRFLDGLRALCTVISSGDAETHDHPRPTIVAASATTGRRFIDVEEDSLVAPLIYITEVARSVKIGDVKSLKEYHHPQPERLADSTDKAALVHNTKKEKARFRLFYKDSAKSSADAPRIDQAQVVTGLRYGLVNVRTDGKRLFFAQLEESGNDWAFTVLTEKQISEAR